MSCLNKFVKRNFLWILLALLLAGSHLLYLYLLPASVEDIGYAAVLDACLLGLFFFLAWMGYIRRVKKFQKLLALPIPDQIKVPEPVDDIEQLYGQILENVAIQQRLLEDQTQLQQTEMYDYYARWVHQIKTPIAAMKLTLQGQDDSTARRLRAELGRVEQYVDMALTYLRLEEGGSDYVIRTCAVDDVVRAAVRRFAGEFIDRRIALDYTPVEWETVTDGKWLTFVVEQLLSNALKYTGQDGTVRIYREGDDLCIRDSGMGIAPEDLPRVFDMGYTGQNGRLDRRSSGIGLYLCRRICRNLRHEIRIESVPGVGTTVRLTLGRGDFLPE